MYAYINIYVYTYKFFIIYKYFGAFLHGGSRCADAAGLALPSHIPMFSFSSRICYLHLIITPLFPFTGSINEGQDGEETYSQKPVPGEGCFNF